MMSRKNKKDPDYARRERLRWQDEKDKNEAMNKRKFYTSRGIDWNRFGLGIVIEKQDPYFTGDPNAYVCCFYFGPLYLALHFDWERIKEEVAESTDTS